MSKVLVAAAVVAALAFAGTTPGADATAPTTRAIEVPVIGLVEGQGVFARQTVPQGVEWLLRSVGFRMKTSNATHMRRIRFAIDNGSDVLFRVATDADQGPASTGQYYIGAELGYESDRNPRGLTVMGIPEITLQPGWRFEVMIYDGTRGDQFTSKVMAVVEETPIP